MKDFDKKLREYAVLLVRTGANVQPGQTLLLQSPVECADLARLCAEEAYAAGAREVDVQFSDDVISRLKYLHAADEVFDAMPDWAVEHFEHLRKQRAAKLTIIGADPEAMRGVDASRIQRWSQATGRQLEAYYREMTANVFAWCLGGYATPKWAKKVFPDLPEAEAVEQLWEQIFAAARVTGDGNAAQRWAEHSDELARRTQWLNDHAFKTLHYQNSLGTDLTVELPEGHFWAGGSENTQDGVCFSANIPTEEVFTLPLKTGVNGTVVASKPLVLSGQIIEGIRMEFKDGRIVKATAEKGEEALQKAVATDEGSAYLGEVALVPTASPISESGILFYNTLFDENASCHLAFGDAYPCIHGAENMSEEELRERGVNISYMHEDFMVGTPDLSIIGTTADGTEVPVFENGNFAF